MEATGWQALHKAQTRAGTIHYRDVGRQDAGAPVVVLLHLVLANSEVWRETAAVLAPHVRCIVPDLPMGAHHSAMDPDADLSLPGLAGIVADLLERLDLAEVTLVGNDTGGAVAQTVAANHPERLGGLVLANCDAFENYPPRAFRHLVLTAALPGGVGLLGWATKFHFMRRSRLAFGLITENIDHAAIDGWLEAAADPGVRRDAKKVLRAMHRRHTLAAAEGLKRFDKPALVVWGTGDTKVFPLTYGERLAAQLPKGRLELVQGARTLVPWDAPDRLAELIAEFATAGRDRVA